MLMSDHHLGKGRGNGQKCAPARGHAVLINAISNKNDSIQKEKTKISAQVNGGDTETKKRHSVDFFLPDLTSNVILAMTCKPMKKK